MIPLSDREQAVLDVLREAQKPMRHDAICKAIKHPWYNSKRSFEASVSSILGSLRSKGLIAPVEVRQQREIRTLYGRKVRPTVRSWFVTPQGMGFHSGGIVRQNSKPRIVGDQGQLGFYPHQVRAIEKITTVQPVWRQCRPHTDDMKQMLDDLGIKPPMDFVEYNQCMQREIANAFGLTYEQLVKRNHW